MNNSNFRKVTITSAIAFGGILLGACSWGADDEYVADKVAAEEYKAAASPSMESAIDGVLSGDNLDLSNFDASEFQKASDEYSKAIEADKNDTEALFGRALTSVIAVMGEPGVEDAIDEVVGDNNPMIAQGNSSTAVRLAKIATASDSEFPKLSKIQDDLSIPFLEALDQAIKDLEKVTQDGAFSMEVTIDQDSRIVGLSEAFTLLAGYRVLRAQMTLVFCRNFDVDDDGSYEFIDVLQEESMGSNLENGTLSNEQEAALNHLVDLARVGSPFLTIRDGWEDRVNAVIPQVKQAALDFQSAIDLVEQDSKYLMNTQDMNESDRSEMSDALDSLVKYTETPFEFTLEHGASIEVYLPALVTVNDPKTLFPYYDFYDTKDWSMEKPVFYFTDGSQMTGNLENIVQVLTEDLKSSQKVLKLKEIIHFQDPSFAGALPGMTRSKLWKLIYDEEVYQESMDAFYY